MCPQSHMQSLVCRRPPVDILLKEWRIYKYINIYICIHIYIHFWQLFNLLLQCSLDTKQSSRMIYMLNFFSNLLLHFPFRGEGWSFVKMYCYCILKLRECHHINQVPWQGSLFCVWKALAVNVPSDVSPGTDITLLFHFPLIWSVGLFLSVPEWVPWSSFINLLSGRYGSVHTEGVCC